MRINIDTDYALRTMIVLAKSAHPVADNEISRVMEIPQENVDEALSRLEKAGLVNSADEQTDGYELSKQPKDISLLEMIEKIDNKPMLCNSGGLEENSFVRKVHGNVHKNLVRTLGKVTLESLAEQV